MSKITVQLLLLQVENIMRDVCINESWYFTGDCDYVRNHISLSEDNKEKYLFVIIYKYIIAYTINAYI
jgi:hypothetical protein